MACNELSLFEKWFWAVTTFGDSLVINVSIIEPQDVEITKDLLLSALNYMCMRHPLFRAHVKRDTESKKLFFEIAQDANSVKDQMDIKISQLDSEENLISELEKFNDKLFKFEQKCLLWRVKLLNYIKDSKNMQALALVVPAFATDGVNITVISWELLNILNSIIQGKECEEMLEKLELHPSLIDTVHKHNIFPKEKQELRASERQNELDINFTLPYKFKDLDQHGTKIHLYPLDSERTQHLIHESRKRNVTLTALIIAATYHAFKRLYEENNLAMQKDMTCIIPANLRFRLQPKVNFSHMRPFVSGVHIGMSYPNITGDLNNIWNEADYIANAVVGAIDMETGRIFDFSHNFQIMQHELDNYEKFENDSNRVRELFNCENSCDLVMSNIGVYAENEKKVLDGPLKLLETYFGDSLPSYPNICPAVMFHINTWRGRMMIEMSSQKTVFAPRYSDRFFEHFKNVLRSV